MKILPEHAAFIEANVLPVMRAMPSIDGYPGKDPAMRWRWDAMWKANLSQWVSDTIYKYADDSHIDTVLRAVQKKALDARTAPAQDREQA